MGWVSHMEDDFERAEQDLFILDRFLGEPWHSKACAHEEVLRRVDYWASSIRAIKREIEDILNLATDPNIQLASDSIQLRETVALQQQTILKLQCALEEQASKSVRLEVTLGNAWKERDEWRRRARQGSAL